MIRSFRSPEAARIFRLERSRRLPGDIQQVALRKLRMINRAVSLADLRLPPVNRLDHLRGDGDGLKYREPGRAKRDLRAESERRNVAGCERGGDWREHEAIRCDVSLLGSGLCFEFCTSSC